MRAAARAWRTATIPQVPYLREAAQVVLEVQARDIAAQGLVGEAIGVELRKRRQERLKAWVAEKRTAQK
jgi:hypothetical protein